MPLNKYWIIICIAGLGLILSAVYFGELLFGYNNKPDNRVSNFFPGAQNVHPTDPIRLPYDKTILHIDFVALENSLLRKIQFKHLLKAKERDWNNIGNQRSIIYSPNHVPKFRSTIAPGFWNSKEKTVHITALPPGFNKWWAYLLFIGAVGVSAFGYLYYHRKQTIMHYKVKLAAELNEKTISYITNISHELRTPLSMIVGPVKQLLHSNRTNLDAVDISTVYRNSRRLLSLVDQLLLFSSTDNELADLQPSVIILNDVCHEVFLCFDNQVHDKNLTYQFKSPTGEIRLYADQNKLETALFNLLSNAIKYTPKNGSVALEIIYDEKFVEILVADNGPGMPQEAGESLFENFYNLPEQTKAASQSGFGLGLYLAKRCIDMHKGQLTFSSKPGQGTTFKIQLPMVDITGIPVNPVYQMSSSEYDSPLLHELIVDSYTDRKQNRRDEQVNEILGDIINKKAAIMLIDDDNETRSYIKKLLGEHYTVFEAENAEIGFEMVLENEPDMILCDVVMPGMSGVEFCSKLKDSPSFRHIPVILLTGTSSSEIQLKAIECGADDYITKPFENDRLLARIKSMLKGRDALKEYFLNEITSKNNSLKIPSEYCDFLSKCILIIERHLADETFTLKTLTDEIAMSRSNLSRKIKSISGLSTSEFIRYIRLRKAAPLMVQTDMQIKEIAFKTGFQDIKYFREQFHKLFDMNPSDLIKKHRKTFIPNSNLNSAIVNQRVKNWTD